MDATNAVHNISSYATDGEARLVIPVMNKSKLLVLHVRHCVVSTVSAEVHERLSIVRTKHWEILLT